LFYVYINTFQNNLEAWALNFVNTWKQCNDNIKTNSVKTFKQGFMVNRV